jgi:hypothetical protein
MEQFLIKLSPLLWAGISRRGGTRRSVGLAFSLSLALSLSSNYYTVSRMLLFYNTEKILVRTAEWGSCA